MAQVMAQYLHFFAFLQINFSRRFFLYTKKFPILFLDTYIYK